MLMPSQHGVSIQVSIRDGPLENLWGGRAKYTQKNRARENYKKKILARQLTLKNIHAMT